MGEQANRVEPWDAGALKAALRDAMRPVSVGCDTALAPKPSAPATELPPPVDAAVPQVVMSYPHADAGPAERLRQRLLDHGYTVWWDRDLAPGTRYRAAISRMIRKAPVTAVIWNEAAVASAFVEAEAALANDLGTLLPLLDPRFDPKDIPLGLGATHCGQLGDFQALLTALRERGVRPQKEKGAEGRALSGPDRA